jgi:DNA-nicking Smr family endonuclease
MAKKRKSRTQEPKPRASQPVFSSPFRGLKKMLADRAVEPPPSPVPPLAPPAPAPREHRDDASLLDEAMAGVRPLARNGAGRITIEPRVRREIVSEDAEALAQLSDLVSGHTPFDITETEEHLEGMRVGLDPRLLTRLRRGEFAMQSHLDLHGMVQQDASAALERFVVETVRKGHRAILIVTGRGRRSPGGRPVLKHAASRWLSHGLVGGHVLAFCTARPADGGAGAIYVLLRRDRKRAPFEILEGAKRRD